MSTVVVTGLDDLVAAFAGVPLEVRQKAERVVSKGSLNIKQGAIRRVTGHAHLPQYPRSISYDIDARDAVISSEIGPDKDRPQGALGNIVEYGSLTHPAPIPHLGPELALEEPRFVRAIGDLGEEMLR